ncbi:MAG: hypothetical protein KatS3mg061_0445 [Dehalococcoidia bacterium]|nr:MAG: hypothetical protein KatS3mg061_0445 [Dehalococcoidia bacterium]
MAVLATCGGGGCTTDLFGYRWHSAGNRQELYLSGRNAQLSIQDFDSDGRAELRFAFRSGNRLYLTLWEDDSALTAAGFQPVNERFPAEYARLLAECQLLRRDYAPLPPSSLRMRWPSLTAARRKLGGSPGAGYLRRPSLTAARLPPAGLAWLLQIALRVLLKGFLAVRSAEGVRLPRVLGSSSCLAGVNQHPASGIPFHDGSPWGAVRSYDVETGTNCTVWIIPS